MTNEQLDEILIELRAIRAALEAKPRAATPATATTATTATATPNTLPLPTIEIVDAGSVPVHFGKNTGVPISQLTDKQLLWYGSERPASLKKDGTPFPPREADIQLLNACRTLWHQRKSGAPMALVSQPATTDNGENLPF
jgi:hypothetical protein